MVYRWWADEEFGTIFTHDHMFANYRQKHGLFAALLVEPKTATFHDPQDLSRRIIAGQNAVIAYEEDGESKAYREFCLGNGDWVPLFKRAQPIQDDRHILSLAYGKPLEPPPEPDSHGDNGVFGLNYRCEPLAERPRDPSEWFSSKSFLPSEGKSWGAMRAISSGDPATPLFHTWPGERIRLRLLQGSHEEQHSFQIHGLRWRR
ncbi:MAG: hypothetical protein ACK59G_04295, partial [Cyanobacteriota bacterium]